MVATYIPSYSVKKRVLFYIERTNYNTLLIYSCFAYILSDVHSSTSIVLRSVFTMGNRSVDTLVETEPDSDKSNCTNSEL